jgi:hypothetical protein
MWQTRDRHVAYFHWTIHVDWASDWTIHGTAFDRGGNNTLTTSVGTRHAYGACYLLTTCYYSYLIQALRGAKLC